MAPSEDVARLVQLQIKAAQTVMQHPAPTLVFAVQHVLRGIVARAVVDPAHAALDGIREGGRSHKARAVNVADVLHDLRLHVGHVHVVLGARQHLGIHAGAALGADHPVQHRRNLVVHQWHLPALAQNRGVLVAPLDVVVEVGVDRHLQPVLGLAVALRVEPRQQFAQFGAGFIPVQVVRRRHGRCFGFIGADATIIERAAHHRALNHSSPPAAPAREFPRRLSPCHRPWPPVARTMRATTRSAARWASSPARPGRRASAWRS